ncbi:MAG: WYL domain-containing protein [Deltaproteobacteria bacterium]|nr:WYL domain-containing protein [Myxococcales bacterium]MDP3218335.1 WYL domain-containing protein [Deltaproteobacteria bacterium]
MMNPTARAPSLDSTSIARDADLESQLRIAAPANDPPPGPQQQAVLRRVARAIQERRVCVLRYASEPGGAPSTRAIEPIAVVSTRGALGLLAWCRLRRDLRTFRLDRIAAIALAAEHFTDHPGLALERFIQRRRRTLP